MDKTEILTNAGVIIAGVIAILAGYFRKPKDPARGETRDTVVTSVGLEFGNRLQKDLELAELKRIADSLAIIADRKQATTEAKLDRVLEELAEAEEREREARAKPARARRAPRSRKPGV